MSGQITVIPYAGHRGDEAPRAFFLGGVRIDVASVLESWVEEAAGTRVRLRLFVVKGGDGRTHTLACDDELGMWFHRSP
jgi:hypothetical protein